ncbi:MAG: CoA transferase [Chloroflexi bacterium]|nr:CoA transferase [Chloroflexota bacterium]
MTKALEGLRVLDLARLAPGMYGSMLLADFGADVLMVEIPPGAVARFASRHRGEGEDPEREIATDPYRRNKRSIAINLREPDGLELFYRLVDDVDVVLDGFRPGVTERLGIDYATLSARNPRIITGTLSGYGRTGPYAQMAGHDINYISIGGALGMIGGADGRPAIPLNLVADFAGGGLLMAFAVLLAVQARERTGRGQDIDLAMSDGVTSLLGMQISRMFNVMKPPPPRGEHPLGGGRCFYNVYQCADGKWVSVGAIEPYFFEALCHGLGLDELIPHQNDDDRQQEMMDAFAAAFATRPRDEWFAVLGDADACLTPVLGLDEMAADAHVRERGLIQTVEDPRAGTVEQVGVAPMLLGTPGEVRLPSARLGEHTDDVLGSLGLPGARIAELRERGVVA